MTRALRIEFPGALYHLTAIDWQCSSYRATAGIQPAHPCLITDWVLYSFGDLKQKAQSSYQRFVHEGKGQPSPWELLKNQIYLGSDQFVEDMQCKMDPEQPLDNIPIPQKAITPKTPELLSGKLL